MASRSQKVASFRALHRAGCFIIPNPWDIGSATMLAGLGFKALATTSSGYAFSRGKTDGSDEVGRDETLAYAAAIAASTDLPVSADLEDCYAETAAGVAETIRLAAEAGLAGVSIEDRQPDPANRIRGFADAHERVAVAVEAAQKHDVVLTARADGMTGDLYGLDEAIRRLQAYEKLGAEVLYAPGVKDADMLRTICRAVARPVNHVTGLGAPGLTFAQIAEAGVRRISLGGSLARAAGGAFLALATGIANGDLSALDEPPSWGALRKPPKIIAD